MNIGISWESGSKLRRSILTTTVGKFMEDFVSDLLTRCCMISRLKFVRGGLRKIAAVKRFINEIFSSLNVIIFRGRSLEKRNVRLK